MNNQRQHPSQPDPEREPRSKGVKAAKEKAEKKAKKKDEPEA